MEILIAKVTEILKAQFSEPSLRVELEETIPNEKLGGVLVWSGFYGMEQIDRQRKLRLVLRQHLPPEEVLDVGLILTLTPQEIAALEEMGSLAA